MGRVGRPPIPPMPAEHDCYFCAWGGVLVGRGVGVEDYAESALGVLGVGDCGGEEVAETVHGEGGGVRVEEVYYHYGYGGG